MDSRTKNVSRNIAVGILNRVVTLLLPFVTRTLLIYLIGTTSAGATTLFTSILSFLSLAELGFGAAVVYLMYKPIAENDIPAINALLKYYRTLYRVIGTIILVVGLVLTPFLPYLIKGKTPEGVNLYVLYLLYLINSVISYFLAGYRQSLLVAHQRSDIRDKVAIGVTLLVRVSEIIVIYFTRNLYGYVLVAICGTVLTNIITAAVTRRMFPELHCEGKVPEEARKEVRKRLGGLFGTKLNAIVVNQADSLVISAFLGLTLLAQYGNYYYVLNAVSSIVMTVFTSMTASIGNKIAKDSEEKIYKLFKNINFANSWLVGWCAICMVCLYQPFMIIWVKEKLTLPLLMSVMMSLYFYVYQVQRTILTFKDAGGLWYEDRYRPYVSMTLNLVSNLILVQVIGIYGIVVSTILAFLISVPWCNYVVFKYMFHREARQNIFFMLGNLVITAVIGAFTFLLCSFCMDGFIGFAEKAAICFVVPNLIYFILFRKKPEFEYMKNLGLKIIKRRV